MRATRWELLDLLDKLEKEEPCGVHGREALVICLNCKMTIWCEECDRRQCQCENDA